MKEEKQKEKEKNGANRDEGEHKMHEGEMKCEGRI